jgi:hypothetical protein
MLSVVFGGLESWREAAQELGNAAAVAVALWDELPGASACQAIVNVCVPGHCKCLLLHGGLGYHSGACNYSRAALALVACSKSS